MGIPSNVIRDIARKGRLYEVGGAVRDRILVPNRRGKDVDYLVTGIPLDGLVSVLRARGKVDLVGKSFGVIKFTPGRPAIGEDEPRTYDIALPRKDISTGPGHKDFQVDFDYRLPVEEDLVRRDFTINAMALELKPEGEGEIIDILGGREDLRRKIIRMVNPRAFEEDPLRMIRGVQFAARFEFEIEPETYRAMREHASSIRTVAPERIQEELVKLLTRAVRPSIGFRLMRETGLLREILPELDQAVGVDQPGGYHAFDVFEHSLATLDASPADLIQRLAALLHDVGKPATRNLTLDGATFYGHDRLAARMTREALQRLRFSRDITEVVVLLVRFHMFTMGPGVTDKGLRRLVRRVGEDHIYELLNTRRADIVAQGRDLSTQEVDEFEARIQIELAEKPPLGLKALTVNGNDVMRRFGLAPGPLVGRILDHLLETVLDRPEMNEKEALLDEARRFLEERKP